MTRAATMTPRLFSASPTTWSNAPSIPRSRPGRLIARPTCRCWWCRSSVCLQYVRTTTSVDDTRWKLTTEAGDSVLPPASSPCSVSLEEWWWWCSGRTFLVSFECWVMTAIPSLPCKNAAVITFKPKPTHPKMNTSFGSSTCSIETRRSMDWRRMLIPKASRKEPLKKAPRRRARCQPKDKSWRNSVRLEIWKRSQRERRNHNSSNKDQQRTMIEVRVTPKPTKSFN